MDLISVIIPVYNVEEYLKECVDSVLSQTYRNIEIILVDDDSTDSSGKICDEYAQKDKRIRVIHRENGGLSVARNTGFEAANGEYIFFLDSDDCIFPYALEQLLETAQKEQAQMVFFDAVSFCDSSDSVNIKQNYMRKNHYASGNGFEVFSQLQKRSEYRTSAVLLFFSKEFLSEKKLRFVTGILHEDMIFTYEAFCSAQRVAHCNKPLYRRRYRDNSIMTSKKNEKHFEGSREVYYAVKEISSQNHKSETVAAKKYTVRCAFNALNTYKKIEKELQKKYREDYRSLKEDILNNGAYGDKALKMRCYGKPFWIFYKIYEKTVGKLLKK